MTNKPLKNRKLPKRERLKGIKNFSLLATGASHVFSYPIKLFYRIAPEGDGTCRIAVVAPKKIFKRAVDRNFVKRKMREAYRNNKEAFAPCNNNLHMLWVFISKDLKDVDLIAPTLPKLAQKLILELKEKNTL